jgi:hypothetical protein
MSVAKLKSILGIFQMIAVSIFFTPEARTAAFVHDAPSVHHAEKAAR